MGAPDAVGGPVTDPGSSTWPHNITCDDAGWVYVAAARTTACRCRRQRPLWTQWNNMHRPSWPVHAARQVPRSATSARSVPISAFNRGAPNLGRALPLVDNTGKADHPARRRAGGRHRTGAVPFAARHRGRQPRKPLHRRVGYTAWPRCSRTSRPRRGCAACRVRQACHGRA